MNDAVTIAVERLPHADGLPLPRYETVGAAGLDLIAAVPDDRPAIIGPAERALLPTGLALGLPLGYEGQIRSRSGLALKHGLTVLNAPGTIDADYRGEVGVILVNLGQEPVTVTRGMRIAQLVVARVARAELVAVPALGATGRGAAGFGSTGH